MRNLREIEPSWLLDFASRRRGRARAYRTQIVQRGIDRGEPPTDTDAALISELFSAPIIHRLLSFGETVQSAYIESVIDIVLAGAKARI